MSAVRKIDFQTGEVIKFKSKEDIKLKKDGTPKMTPCNAKEDRDNVYPFKEDDIPKIISYLKDKIRNSKNKEDEDINRRNQALFIMGINIGLRVSDLVSLKWEKIYDENWNIIDHSKVKPIKTRRKNKHVDLIYNDAFAEAIEWYRKYRKPQNLDGYIFKSREGGHISERAIYQMIKKAARECDLKYNVGTHSMRKTFARVRYDNSTRKDQTLVELMKIFNHSEPSVTLDYICIGKEELSKLFNAVNLGNGAGIEWE